MCTASFPVGTRSPLPFWKILCLATLCFRSSVESFYAVEGLGTGLALCVWMHAYIYIYIRLWWRTYLCVCSRVHTCLYMCMYIHLHIALRMEALQTSETLVKSTRCYKSGDSHLHSHRRENIESYKSLCFGGYRTCACSSQFVGIFPCKLLIRSIIDICLCIWFVCVCVCVCVCIYMYDAAMLACSSFKPRFHCV
jgi:hypothetical protein